MSLKSDNKRLYEIWRGMRGRCQNPNRPKYSIYGGRGITVCDEWQSFANFHKWAMANGYREDLTIDRFDNDGDYCPENCRWATPLEQIRNRSNTLKATFAGETHTLAEWSRIVGLNYYLLRSRLKRGMDIETAFTTPSRKKVKKNGI